jgi:hypothetical protein
MKLKITLTLDTTDAETLVETLKIGASYRYAPRLQAESSQIARYVAKRVDDAVLARGRAHRRADTKREQNHE